jgi:hypothetical protein
MPNVTRHIAAVLVAIFTVSALSLTAAPAFAGEEVDPWTLEQCAQELGDVRSAAIADRADLSAALYDAERLAEARYHRIVELEQTVRNQAETIAHLTTLAQTRAATIERLRAKLAATR